MQFWKNKLCIYDLLHFSYRRFYPIFMILGLINIIQVKHKWAAPHSAHSLEFPVYLSFSSGSMDIAMIRKQYGRKLLMLNIWVMYYRLSQILWLVRFKSFQSFSEAFGTFSPKYVQERRFMEDSGLLLLFKHWCSRFKFRGKKSFYIKTKVLHVYLQTKLQ